MSFDQSTNFLTVQEVADILRFSVLTIYKYIKEGKLNAVEFGGHYRVDGESLNKFIENHRVCSLTDNPKNLKSENEEEVF